MKLLLNIFIKNISKKIKYFKIYSFKLQCKIQKKDLMVFPQVPSMTMMKRPINLSKCNNKN